MQLRNVPTQARSRERLQRLLDAGSTVLATEGATALTTTRIADVAGVPVGSLYHFFAEKEDVVEALALSSWQRFEAAVTALADGPAQHDPVGAVLGVLAQEFRADAGFRALWFGDLRTARVRDATRPMRAGFVAAVARMLAARWPEASDEARAAAAEMVVRTGDGLLREAFRVDEQGDAALLDESAFLLRAYLEARLA